MKKCRVCKEEKSSDEYGYNGTATRKDGFRYRRTICRPCDATRRREEHAENPDKIRESNRNHYKKNAQKYRDKTAKWRKENPEKQKEMLKKWHLENKGYARDYRLKYTYGISQKDYEDMYEEQKGTCYICHTFKDKLVIDHDHETCEVRKLLCCGCNTFIGKIEKNKERFVNALKYLDLKIPRSA